MASTHKRDVTALVVAFSVGLSFSQLPPGRGRVMQILRGQGLEVVSDGSHDLAKRKAAAPTELTVKNQTTNSPINFLYAKLY